ncbi:MAG: hypothetical protein QOE66_2597, partial [Chloroflexota bacterium]|nr:hypothetical protein [Chloroflexota bacterium]
GLALDRVHPPDPKLEHQYPDHPPDPKLEHQYPDHARAALRTAIRLGSTNYAAYIAAANIDEYRKKYAAARQTWTALIDLIGKQYEPNDRDLNLSAYNCYHHRARVTAWLALERQGRGIPEARDEIRSLFLEAIEDLDRSQVSLGVKDPAWKYSDDFIRAEAEIGLGDLEVDLDRAGTHYRRAEKIFNRLPPKQRGFPAYELLARKLEDRSERLEGASPKDDAATP